MALTSDNPYGNGFNNIGGIDYRLRRLETGAPRLRRGAQQFSSGTYTRIPAKTIDTSTGRFDLTQTAVKKWGSVPPTTNTNGFAYTADGTSIHWYWDGTNSSKVPVIRRADHSTFVVPAGDLNVTGLAPSTRYYFYPFWETKNQCNIGWVPGLHGTPAIAFLLAETQDNTNGPIYLIQQSFQEREPLTNGSMYADTTAGGGGGGGAGGGGAGGGCVMSGTEIVTLGDIDYRTQVLEEFDWIRLESEDGRILNCTGDHPLFHSTVGRVEASKLLAGDPLIMDNGERRLRAASRFHRKCSKYKVQMKEGHLFYANGFLSHNVKAQQ